MHQLQLGTVTFMFQSFFVLQQGLSTYIFFVFFDFHSVVRQNGESHHLPGSFLGPEE